MVVLPNEFHKIPLEIKYQSTNICLFELSASGVSVGGFTLGLKNFGIDFAAGLIVVTVATHSMLIDS